MSKHENMEKIERVTIKMPRSLAEYFREEFPHGKRSDFVAACILRYKKEQNIKKIEEELREVGKNRKSLI